jgi:hypothetical protein
MSAQPEPVPVVSDGRPMTYPTPGGDTVTVTEILGSRIPYDWTCTAGHYAEQRYSVLSYCRDDAKAHANDCRTPGGAA